MLLLVAPLTCEMPPHYLRRRPLGVLHQEGCLGRRPCREEEAASTEGGTFGRRPLPCRHRRPMTLRLRLLVTAPSAPCRVWSDAVRVSTRASWPRTHASWPVWQRRTGSEARTLRGLT